jgi:hypothetical protein
LLTRSRKFWARGRAGGYLDFVADQVVVGHWSLLMRTSRGPRAQNFFTASNGRRPFEGHA